MYKKLFLGLLFFILLSAAVGLGFYLGQTKNPTKGSNIGSKSISPSPSYPTATSSAKDESVDENIVAIGANTVSFGRMGNETKLRYRGKYYDDSNQFAMEPISLLGAGSYQWYGLVDSPVGVPAGEFMLDEVFGFKPMADNRSFVFIMRWGIKNGDKVDQSYYLYYYNPEKAPKLTLIRKFDEGDGLSIPKINQVSTDGRYLALDMFSCWNCGGHKPETLLLNLETLQTKNIGKVSYFAWRAGGAYDYKDYVVIACEGESMGECSEKPESLPMKTGSME